jgi:hypothetical protein
VLAKMTEAVAAARQLFNRPATLQVTRVPGAELPPGLARIRDQAVVVGLKRLLAEKHFSITSLESLLAAAMIIPDGDAMRVLRALHCVDWADMPADLRRDVANLCVSMLSPEEETAV